MRYVHFIKKKKYVYADKNCQIKNYTIKDNVIHNQCRIIYKMIYTNIYSNLL